MDSREVKEPSAQDRQNDLKQYIKLFLRYLSDEQKKQFPEEVALLNKILETTNPPKGIFQPTAETQSKKIDKILQEIPDKPGHPFNECFNNCKAIFYNDAALLNAKGMKVKNLMDNVLDFCNNKENKITSRTIDKNIFDENKSIISSNVSKAKSSTHSGLTDYSPEMDSKAMPDGIKTLIRMGRARNGIRSIARNLIVHDAAVNILTKKNNEIAFLAGRSKNTSKFYEEELGKLVSKPELEAKEAPKVTRPHK